MIKAISICVLFITSNAFAFGISLQVKNLQTNNEKNLRPVFSLNRPYDVPLKSPHACSVKKDIGEAFSEIYTIECSIQSDTDTKKQSFFTITKCPGPSAALGISDDKGDPLYRLMVNCE